MGMKRYLSPSEVAELAELLEDWPVRVGVVDEVLEAARQRRGMTLVLEPGRVSNQISRI